MKYRIILRSERYIPQYRRFFFWHCFHEDCDFYESSDGYGYFNSFSDTIIFLHDVIRKKKEEKKKVVFYYNGKKSFSRNTDECRFGVVSVKKEREK